MTTITTAGRKMTDAELDRLVDAWETNVEIALAYGAEAGIAGEFADEVEGGEPLGLAFDRVLG